ncbi:MAG TPA: nucleoside-diphosphate sugar epimerase/dehydratase [Anaerolineaceae bacterium]|nr:nucleoside-diphosphate sugar epimerase/dehydratase [Anaerolineaceae bacterium]
MRTKPNMRNRYMVIIDIILTVIAVLGAYTLRLELGALFFFYLPSAYWMIAVSLLIKIPIYYLFGLYRRLWGYASTKELRLIIIAVTSASILVSVIMILLLTFRAFNGFPRSVLIIDWLLSIFLIGGTRFTIRLIADNVSTVSSSIRNKQAKRSLIIGAGDAGALVVRELQKNPDLNLTPVGFLDDNTAKLKQQIHGIPVVGTLADIGKVLEHRKIEEVIIAIPSSSGKVVRMIADVCRLRGIPFRTMPGLYELIGGKVSINRLREVDITDLLRRQPAHMQEELIGQTLTDKRVMVTGAGGSIGRELCRQIARWQPSHLILLGHGENSIFESLLELQENSPSLALTPVIADVRDYQRIHNIFALHKPDIVFHAAAHKHVPLMEMNVDEAIDNNVRGTLNVVRACEENAIQRLVMISTDKAIRPANIMGATKRFSEMIVLDAAARTGHAYCVVRFGNVLGSRGSVVPLFKHQIATGGPVTITHPDMKRYFMTIPEAVYLVLQAAGMSNSGETFVLNMGQQVRILDLAEDLIRLSGLEPGKDIEIVFTGIRPGEKLSEDLWEEGNQFEPTQHPDIYQFDDPTNLHGEELKARIDQLLTLADEGKAEEIISLIDETIPGASLGSTPPPELLSIE